MAFLPSKVYMNFVCLSICTIMNENTNHNTMYCGGEPGIIYVMLHYVTLHHVYFNCA